MAAIYHLHGKLMLTEVLWSNSAIWEWYGDQFEWIISSAEIDKYIVLLTYVVSFWTHDFWTLCRDSSEWHGDGKPNLYHIWGTMGRASATRENINPIPTDWSIQIFRTKMYRYSLGYYHYLPPPCIQPKPKPNKPFTVFFYISFDAVWKS